MWPETPPSRPPTCTRRYGGGVAALASGAGLVALGASLACSTETPHGDYDPGCGLVNGFVAGPAILGGISLGVVGLALLGQSRACSEAWEEHRDWLAHHPPAGRLNGPCNPALPRGCIKGLGCSDGVCVGLESIPPPVVVLAVCEDGRDNDGDELVDGRDPGCDRDGDGSETCDPGTSDCPPCDNGLDDDADGAVDLADLECTSVDDVDERCAWTFVTSALDACTAPPASGDAMSLTLTTQPYVFDTTEGRLRYGATAIGPPSATVTIEGGERVQVWSIRSLAVGRRATLRVTGPHRIVVLVDGTATIEGRVEAGGGLQISSRTHLNVSGSIQAREIVLESTGVTVRSGAVLDGPRIRVRATKTRSHLRGCHARDAASRRTLTITG